MNAVIDRPPALAGIIGAGEAMLNVFRTTERVARSSATVLLLGETGTGKELVARAIHELSPRGSGPYIRVNCGALSESLLESELFGHVKGAFTSAHENRTGRFEAAHGGTLFLDEINSMSFPLQVKLLRVLQEQEFERVGDTRTITVDTRIVAATNRELLVEVEEGRFREDLYYRLNVLPIFLPPLRERTEDLPELIDHFIVKYAAENHCEPLKLTDEALDAMKTYAWPGNVRELENYVERAVVMALGPEFTADLLPPHVRGLSPIRLGISKSRTLDSICEELVNLGIAQQNGDETDLYQQIVSLVEKQLIEQTLKSCHGVQTKTATRLGINRNTLHKKIEEYGLSEDS
ncbi:sigma-54 interaction domain-containing protein [Rubinisphaera margarita]|uniref:sigma-54 interaction domain-containing protein n=1 Tax=Rubinisphaera margarita TaxID=2909586 RepID=UPI001EE7F003|nr:sigma-54 dependent transcriptional regulator [Rubinisphaera margarita]MCG6155986.1 sigma-54 dependent transcriptional regulator [Rubinisphaera margarita]